jgi:hypothetical protein
MSHRTVELLNRWVTDTVRPVPAADIQKEAERLAAEFTAFAADAGFSVEKLEEDVGEDLVGYMIDALEALAEAPGASDDD